MFDNTHKKYNKVERIEKEECDGILDGEVYLFEKIDGANASAWVDNNLDICCGSRNRQVSKGKEVYDDFRGLVEYIGDHEGVYSFLNDFPNLRLFGEWLVKHTINYPQKYQNKFYVFDVYDHQADCYIHYNDYFHLLEKYGIPYIQPFAILDKPTMEHIKKYLGKSNYGVDGNGEGVVVKRYDFMNKFRRNTYGKIVAKDFKEVNNLVFDGCPKYLPVENKIVNKYVTIARVRKMAEKYDLKEMSDIPKLFGLVYNDVITEDIWDIVKTFKKPTIDFKQLNHLSDKAVKNYYIEYLQTKGE